MCQRWHPTGWLSGRRRCRRETSCLPLTATASPTSPCPLLSTSCRAPRIGSSSVLAGTATYLSIVSNIRALYAITYISCVYYTVQFFPTAIIILKSKVRREGSNFGYYCYLLQLIILNNSCLNNFWLVKTYKEFLQTEEVKFSAWFTISIKNIEIVTAVRSALVFAAEI